MKVLLVKTFQPEVVFSAIQTLNADDFEFDNLEFPGKKDRDRRLKRLAVGV